MILVAVSATITVHVHALPGILPSAVQATALQAASGRKNNKPLICSFKTLLPMRAWPIGQYPAQHTCSASAHKLQQLLAYAYWCKLTSLQTAQERLCAGGLDGAGNARRISNTGCHGATLCPVCSYTRICRLAQA